MNDRAVGGGEGRTEGDCAGFFFFCGEKPECLKKEKGEKNRWKKRQARLLLLC